MRYSLGTFLLAMIFVSAVVGVVVLREPWREVENRKFTDEEARAFVSSHKFLQNMRSWISPNGKLRLEYLERISSRAGRLDIFDQKSDRPLGIFENKADGKLLLVIPRGAWVRTFNSDEEFDLVDYPDFRVRRFRQRFDASSLWGHATRPEVIVAVLAGIGLILRIWKNFGKKTAEAGV